MEERGENSAAVTEAAADAELAAVAPAGPGIESRLWPQASGSCPACGNAAARHGGAAAPSWVYAVGRIEPRFPLPSVEKEFAQAAGRVGTAGLTDREALKNVLSQRENRYLVRQLCWVMTIEGLETYILTPRDPADFDLLLEALRARPSPADLDCVVGLRGPTAPPQMCNGLMVPIVIFDQLYFFDRESLLNDMPRPDKVPAGKFTAAAEELFDRMMQITDNAGATDEYRALNYLAVRYHRIYEAAAEAFARDEALSAVGVQPSPLSGTRKVVEVVFSFTNRKTDVVSKQFVRVDVTEEFPFLVTKLSPYYDR